MEPRTPPILPQELIDHVLDRLAHEQCIGDLKSCALVSRSFRSRSQFALYNKVEINNERQAKRFAQLSPAIHHLVKHLLITNPASGYQNWPHIPSILRSLQRLEHLKLAGITLRASLDSICLPELTHLELHRCLFPSIRASHHLLSSLPSLTSLILLYPAYHEWYPGRPEQLSSRPILSTLVTTTGEIMCSPLPFDASHLQTLRLTLHDDAHISPILQEARASLRHLSLEVSRSIMGWKGSIILGPGRLESLIFKISLRYGDWPVLIASAVDIVQENAANLSDTLLSLTFRHEVMARQLDPSAWACIDTLADALTALEEVRIVFVFDVGGTLNVHTSAAVLFAPHDALPRLKEMVQRVLPKLSASGCNIIVEACQTQSWELEACI